MWGRDEINQRDGKQIIMFEKRVWIPKLYDGILVCDQTYELQQCPIFNSLTKGNEKK